ncbi:MAG: hypothetical protein CL790_06595 [Chloroflexi bacterium]|nr:hypothetical protein [Chloroflexota bacterium]|tara:strand:- start:6770 stop:9661 length:2892 start_codon:yes stop_codon:yes gene_type:complete
MSVPTDPPDAPDPADPWLVPAVDSNSFPDWDLGYNALCAYVVKHDHAQPPINYSTGDGFGLGRWVLFQRHEHERGHQPQNRIERLDAILGWTWDPVQSEWERGFEALKTLFEEIGTALTVPLDHVTKWGHPLGEWSARQEKLAETGKLSADRRKRLESIGVDWQWNSVQPARLDEGIDLRPNPKALDMFFDETRRQQQHLRPFFNFVAKIAALYPADSVLDPYCGGPTLLEAVAEEVQATTVHGNADVGSFHKIGDRISIFGPMQGIDPEPPKYGLGERGQYDLIVSHMSSYVAGTEPHNALPNQGASLSQQMRYALNESTFRPMRWALSRLDTHGAAILVLPEHIIQALGAEKELYETEIGRRGLRIRAVIHTGNIVGKTWRKDKTDFVTVLEPGSQEDVFIGQYTDDVEQQNTLFANLEKHQEGEGANLGRLTPLTEFYGYEQFVASEQLKRYEKTIEWISYSVDDLFIFPETVGSGYGSQAPVPEISETPTDGTNVLTSIPDDVDIKVVGTFPEVARELKDDLKIRPTDVFIDSGGHLAQNIEEMPLDDFVWQLRLNPKVTFPKFFVEWAKNSRIGDLTLDIARGYAGFDTEALRDVPIYLPALDEQRRILEIKTRLGEVQAEVEQAEAALWSGSEQANAIHDVAARYARPAKPEQKREDWIESLPYPLASTLSLAIRRATSNREWNDYLFRFFETLAGFLAIVHLSAFRSSSEAWARYGPDLEKALQRYAFEDAPSFGVWKAITEFLSTRFRKSPEDLTENENDLRSTIYHTQEETVLTMLTDSRIRSVLDTVVPLRNKYPAHGGLIDDSQERLLREELDSQLEIVRTVFGTTWEKYELILAGSSDFINGVRYYDVERIVGDNRTFEKARRVINEDLQRDSLFLYDPIAQTALELLPLIRIGPAPQSQVVACYLYNGREGAARRFKSNEFPQEGNISELFPTVDHTFEHLFEFEEEPEG